MNEIPGASSWEDHTDNDATGAEGPANRCVNIFQPGQGTYNAQITGLSLGTYILEVVPFAQDGSAEPRFFLAGIAGPGSSSAVQVQFASTPGSTSTVTLAATFQSVLDDIANSLQLGLIDNQGIANSLSRKIIAASVAATGGDNTTAANVMRAFTNQVKRLAEAERDSDEAGKPGTGDDRERLEAEHRQRQDEDREHTGKHITGIAPQVLLADAASLISQLR